MARTHAGSGATGERFGRVTLPHGAALSVTFMLFFAFAAVAAPAPDGRLFEAEWKFSAIVPTRSSTSYFVSPRSLF